MRKATVIDTNVLLAASFTPSGHLKSVSTSSHYRSFALQYLLNMHPSILAGLPSFLVKFHSPHDSVDPHILFYNLSSLSLHGYSVEHVFTLSLFARSSLSKSEHKFIGIGFSGAAVAKAINGSKLYNFIDINL